MERHFSIGVATIVALMAAHRAASARVDTSTHCFQDELSRIDAYLSQGAPPDITDSATDWTIPIVAVSGAALAGQGSPHDLSKIVR
jgi:hypothetical protein